jgi:hypothetical protein
MMVVRWRGILGRVDDGVALVQGYRDILSSFGIPVSEFQLTYRRDELIDEVLDVGRKGAKRLVGFTHRYSLCGVQSYYTAFHSHVVMRHQHDSAACPTNAAGLKFIGKDITL